MIAVGQVLLFLIFVNSLPPVVSLLFGDRYNWPIDQGKLWSDRRPILGSHKTFRGAVSGVAGGLVLFALPGVSWRVAAIAALLAMIGDLISSFIKRRMLFRSGEEVLVLDQLFESLLPLAYLNGYLELSLGQNAAILILFIIIVQVSSRIWLYITHRPLPKKYPRVVKSHIRVHEWRACHEPLARWQTWLNLNSFLSDQIFLTSFFKLIGKYDVGMKNALEAKLVEKTFTFAELPAEFDGFRLLFLTDLHLDGLAGLTEKAASMISSQQVDLCCIGGDLRMKIYGPRDACMRELQSLMQSVQAPAGVFGVLGNHDCIEMLPDCEDLGIIMLVNESWPIEKDGARIWIIGVDDPHFYRLHDADKAAEGVAPEEFSIFLAHSPEAFAEGAAVGANLYLCGHTHGGQICLADGTPLLTNSRAPRQTSVGEWQYHRMQGYTSRGLGASSIPVRFHCPGEITLITLKKKQGGP